MRSAPSVLCGVMLALTAAAQEPAAHASIGNHARSRMPPPVSPHAVLAPPEYVGRRALPDSVLLRINGHEDITARRFARAVRLLGGAPDSLTPADRDRFLELVVEQRLLAARATRDPRPWEHADSLEFLSERDNILLRAALAGQFTRIEQRRRALGLPDLDEQAMGIATRESLMLELKPLYDEELLKTVGGYFAALPRATPNMSPQEQIALTQRNPAIPASDTGRVLARSRLGTLTVAELLRDWRRLASVYRPRVGDHESVRALIENSLFERLIRSEALDPALQRRPEVAAVIADRIEYHSVSQFLQREVVAKIPTDSLTLLAYHGAHRADFTLPPRAVLVLLTLGNERAADSLARRFGLAGEAESLAVRARRGGVSYTHVATATADSELYALALRAGVGGVGGPDKLDEGWRVFKVLSLEPRTEQPFAAVRPQLERAWYEFESDRRIRALLDTLERSARIERNERALRAIVLSQPRAAH